MLKKFQLHAENKLQVGHNAFFIKLHGVPRIHLGINHDVEQINGHNNYVGHKWKKKTTTTKWIFHSSHEFVHVFLSIRIHVILFYWFKNKTIKARSDLYHLTFLHDEIKRLIGSILSRLSNPMALIWRNRQHSSYLYYIVYPLYPKRN